MEDGDIDRASKEKSRLEQRQREARKYREERNLHWVPVWFYRETDGTWMLKGSEEASAGQANENYWVCRSNHQYSACHELW